MERTLRRARHQAKLDVSEIGNDISDHQEPVILHVNFQIVAQIGALGEQHKVGQRERTGDDLVTLLLRNAHL